ncbi:MAG: pentapeptide repeat-containing protein [Anaerohalosphaeraceae bacterium]|nr:pentapeptide repeat-containing protein [Anaerohalosphaeraceae bacterium]
MRKQLINLIKIVSFHKYRLKRIQNDFLRSLESEFAEEQFLKLLKLMMLVIRLNPADFRKNIENFTGRYLFKSRDNHITVSVVFQDNYLKVQERLIVNPDVSIIFKNERSLIDSLLAPNPDILGSLLREDITYDGNINYVYKFSYMAKRLALMASGSIPVLPAEKIHERKVINMANAFLQGADFRNEDLSNANLKNAYLDKADLRGANLRKALLQGASFKEAFMDEVQLQGAFLSEANFEAASMRKAQLKGATITGGHFYKADLEGAQFQGAELDNAKFQDANLQNVFFDEAKLPQVDFQGASLRKANFHKSTLKNSKFQSANLEEAILRDADLLQADLSTANSFSVKQLAGTNTKGIILSDMSKENLYNFEKITEASKNARMLLRLIMIGCLYIILTIATTPDVNLLLNLMSTPLPIIGGSIQIVGFFIVIPIGLFGFYVYFQLYILRLIEDLSSQPAIFPDGSRLDEKIYPWLLNGFVSMHFPKLTELEKPRLKRFQYYVAITLSWAVMPGTMVTLWWKYLTRHDWSGTILHIAVLALTIWTGLVFLRIAFAVFRVEKKNNEQIPWIKALFNKEQLSHFLSVFIAVVITSYCSYVALEGNDRQIKDPPDLFASIKNTVDQAIISGTQADLIGVDVSERPSEWTGKGGEEEIDFVKGARLKGMNLRFVQAYNAFLVKAELQGANLQGANLQGANLQGANLQGANLKNVVMSYANLEKVKGITLSQLRYAKTLYKAKLDAVLLEQVKKAYPSLLIKPENIGYNCTFG